MWDTCACVCRVGTRRVFCLSYFCVPVFDTFLWLEYLLYMFHRMLHVQALAPFSRELGLVPVHWPLLEAVTGQQAVLMSEFHCPLDKVRMRVCLEPDRKKDAMHVVRDVLSTSRPPLHARPLLVTWL